ncbi:MAG: hypothetical protein H6727_18735 [Myxococcales bacterium]|nr:hypothetical protein [Myxococcales bacterium]
MAGRKRTTRNANSTPKKRKKTTKKASSKKADPKKAPGKKAESRKKKRLPKGLVGEVEQGDEAFVEEEQGLEEEDSAWKGEGPLLIPEHRLEGRLSESARQTVLAPGLAEEGEVGAVEKDAGSERALMKRESQRAPKTPTAHHTDRSKVTVREMEIDDLASVFHLGEKLFTSESYPILYRTWDAYEVTGFSIRILIALSQKAQTRAFGFVMGRTIGVSTAWTYGYVNTWLGVAPGWRQRAGGQQLMDAISRIGCFETEDVRCLSWTHKRPQSSKPGFSKSWAFRCKNTCISGRHWKGDAEARGQFGQKTLPQKTACWGA